MRRVAAIAGQALGMFGRDDRGKPFWLGGVGFMAASAENRGIGHNGFYGRGVLGMFGLRTVAGLAIDVRVFAGRLNSKDIGMAGFAGFVTGVDDGESGNFGHGVGAVVAVLTEAFRDEPCAEAEKENDSK